MSGSSMKGGVKGTLHADSITQRQSVIPNAQVQNVPAARVYVFGDADLAEDELLNDENDAYELRARGKSRKEGSEAKKEKEAVFIERDILEGETLAKIAVKYCCDLAELKRLNNLQTDQDFFALKIIKVPVQRHGLVKERLEEEIALSQQEKARHLAPAKRVANGAAGGVDPLDSVFELSDNEDWLGINDCGEDERDNLLVRTVSIRDTLTSSGKEAQNFLSRMDNDIKSIMSSSSSRKKTLEEVRSSLTCRRIYPLKRRDSILGADCGIKLSTVVITLVIIALVVPLSYFVYYEYVKPRDVQPTVHPFLDTAGLEQQHS